MNTASNHRKSLPLSLLACLVMAACSPKAPDAAPAAAVTPAAAAAPAEAASQEEDVYALVTIPLGKKVPADYPSQIASWKSAGQVEDVVLLEKLPKQLAETGAKSAGFESLAVVELTGEQEYAEWAAQAAATLGPDAIVHRADMLVHDEANPRDAGKAYYAVNHYEALISLPEYKSYTQAYIVPNMGNQKDSGVMTSYTMFLERAGDDARSKAVLLKEYVDQAAFDRSEEIKEKHKPVLLANPEWKRINDTKATLRTDLNETLAKQVVLP